MKKRMIALSLSLLLMAAALPALAEEGGFLGVRLTNETYGLSIAIPADWVEYGFDEPTEETENILLIVADETEARWLFVSTEPADGYTLETLYDALAEQDDYYAGLQFYTLEDMFFLMYEVPTSGYFGAAFLTKDGENIIYVDFQPYGDAAFTELARQILSTIVLI